MFTQVKLELIGYAVWEKWRLAIALPEGQSPSPRETIFLRRPWWVAHIVGCGGKFGLQRRFIRPKVDFSQSDSVFFRGVFGFYLVEYGQIYEAQEVNESEKLDRYFFQISDQGHLVRLTESEVKSALQEKI